MKQHKEPLYQYVKRFETAKEVVELHIAGLIILSKYITSLKD